MSPTVKCEILGIFFNTLSADNKYPVQECEHLRLLTQMQLSQKQKNNFSKFFGPFQESTSNFDALKKKMIVIGYVFPELQTVKNLLRPLFQKRCFRTSFDNQHVKAS